LLINVPWKKGPTIELNRIAIPLRFIATAYAKRYDFLVLLFFWTFESSKFPSIPDLLWNRQVGE
jgi:hypothetical protein